MSNFRELSSGDTTGAKFAAILLARSGTVYMDQLHDFLPYNDLPYFLSERNGHIVSNYPIFPGLMAFPFYAPFVWSGMIQPGDGNLVWDYISKITASTYCALTVLFTFLTLKRFLSKTGALTVSYAYAFGTALWPIASQSIWQHTGAVFWWSVCFYATVRALEEDGSPRANRWLALAGAAAGCTVLCRIIHLVAAGLYGLALLVRFRWRSVWYAIPALALIAALAAYNEWMFSTWNGGLALVLEDRWYLDRVRGGVWSTPLWEGLAGVLFSPSRGVFVFSPILLFSIWGMYAAWRSDDPYRRFFALTGSIPVILFVLLAKYIVWWGGIMHYGPRYQVDVYPFLILFLAAAWPSISRRRALTVLFALLLAFSIWVQWIGAFCYPGRWAVYPVSLSEDKGRLWDWRYNQIWDSFESGVKWPPLQLMQ
ncbi:MAG: hypothetical protein GC154_00410 [bacterium]|nr:hypothetical protein [bacterium]